jgi:mannose-6-phosphate isomerase-like protein (cupin superfamily)
MKYKLTPEESSTLLAQQNDFPFILMMKHGTMTVEYFAPTKTDTQSPHKQDEIYVIIKGHATFLRDNERTGCKANDVLFVPAGMPHRFENFSDDFATWVIFYGAEGGEKE